ncbi:YCF48-related protein [Algoriphagus sp. AK58]|uniref:YCF48-related protein n=1 Tax=Algoriphagus sp. AK58 TaxID=1406877 RepID=UPI00164FEE60|nr:YCF48-related protein [Algoriphagus sp. AK58]MBC6367687.1 hypothetical protein [Algoriphagus sp. AK58]
MKKILSVLFFLVFSVEFTWSQTWTRMQGWGLDFETVHWVNDQKVFAAGENLIIYSENAGTSWNEVLQKFETRFYDISFINESKGVAVGDKGAIFHTNDGGKSWLKTISGTTEHLKSITKIGDTQLITIGDNGTVLISYDSGLSWTKINSNTGLDFNEVFFINENTGFIAAEAGNIFRTFNKGLTWEKIQLSTTQNLNGVLFTSELIGYTVGNQGTFFRTTNGGNTWTASPSNVTTPLKKLAASPIDPRILVVIGDQATLIRSVNSGATFGTINLGAGNTRNLGNLGFRPNTNVLFGIGQNGYMIQSTNGGANWTTRQAGIRNEFSAADFKSNTIGFISGKSGEFFVTTNGAISLISRPLPEKIDIHTIDFWNTAFGYASSAGGKIYRTGNSGSSWVAVPSQTPNKITGFYLFAPSVLYITGNNGYISRSFDSGATWDQTVRSNTQTDLSDLIYFDFGFGLAVGKNGQMSRTFGGSVWESLPKLTQENLNALAKLDTTTALVVGNNGVVLKTKDKAITWEILSFPEKVNLLSVDFWDQNLGFVVGENGVTYQTKDAGKTWFKINSGTTRDLLSINYGDPNSAFAVGKDGTILSYSCTPPGGISPITGNSSECLGTSTYSITSQPEPGSEIVWRVDGGNIITGQGTPSIEVEWTKTGRNAVLVSRVNFCGNGETSALEITVSQIPNLNQPISGEGSVCLETNHTYSVINQNGTTYSWEVTGGEIVTGQGSASVSIIWKTQGNQKISVTPSNSCGKGNPISKLIQVNKTPDQPSAIQGESQTALGEYKYQTTAIPGLNYRWTISGGGRILSGQGSSSIHVIWETEGNFDLSVEAQNECNFGPKRVLAVNVNIITGLEPDPLLQDLILYPNPSHGSLSIQSSNLDSFSELRVINSLGQIIYSSIIKQGSKQEELSWLPRGVHFVQLIDKKRIVTRKVIVN